MTLDQALYLLGLLADTVQAQQAQIDALTAENAQLSEAADRMRETA